MRYSVEDKIHLWGCLDFKGSINAKIADYKTEENSTCTGLNLK